MASAVWVSREMFRSIARIASIATKLLAACRQNWYYLYLKDARRMRTPETGWATFSHFRRTGFKPGRPDLLLRRLLRHAHQIFNTLHLSHPRTTRSTTRQGRGTRPHRCCWMHRPQSHRVPKPAHSMLFHRLRWTHQRRYQQLWIRCRSTRRRVGISPRNRCSRLCYIVLRQMK